MKAKPISSNTLLIVDCSLYSLTQKDILFCDKFGLMDKYLLIVLMFLIAGMIIAITRDPFLPGLFYSMLGGAILVIIYSARKSRKERLRERRKKFKK